MSQDNFFAVRAHFMIFRTFLPALEDRQPHTCMAPSSLALPSGHVTLYSANRESAFRVDVSYFQDDPDLPCRYCKGWSVFAETWCSRLPRLFCWRAGPSSIKCQGTLKHIIAVFHGFSFTWADIVVQDLFFFLKGLEFWKCNNPRSVYLVLVCLMDLPNIFADCLGNFSPGSELGMVFSWCLSSFPGGWESCLSSLAPYSHRE